MKTRSQTKLEAVIDFDAASKAWRENKNVLKNGCFSYKKPVYRLRSTKNTNPNKTI